MPKLSLVVPVYNEERQLESVIENLMNTRFPFETEWIVIDDKSTDDSLEALKRLQPKFGFKLLEQPVNQGKGAAIRRGFQEATGDFVLVQDADFEYDPNDIPALLEPLMQGKADVVCSRFKKSAHQVHRTYHYFVNRFLTVISNLLSGLYLTDMETCYKAFRRDLVQSMNLTSNRFGIEVELTAYVGKIRARVFELPISYFPRTRLQGKKIGWKDGIAALNHLVKYNLFTSVQAAFRELPEKYRC